MTFNNTNNNTINNGNSESGKFRFNCSSFGLTYPKSKLSIESISTWITNEFSDYGLTHWLVTRELHKDGTPHFHAAIKLARSFCTRDARAFDISSEHPNVLRTRNYGFWVQYCKKHGDYKEHGQLTERRAPANQEEIVSNASQLTKLQFLAWAGLNKVTYADKIWELANNNKSDQITLKDGQIFGGTIDRALQSINIEAFWEKDKCLVIIGETGIGKTTWAKTVIPKPCLFVSHIDDLKLFNPSIHVSILFDDVNFCHYPITSQIHLVDWYDNRSIHIRYGVARIPANTRKIFTANTNPIDLNDPAIRRRCQVLTVVKPNMFSNQ